MIGTLPMAALAPLEYRYVLDAALPALAGAGEPLVRCNLPALAGEIRQRIPRWSAADARAALWVEPRTVDWRAELASLAGALPPGAPLVVVASLPLARLLPESRAWGSVALGQQPGGLRRLRRALPRAGFVLEAAHGAHALPAIGLSLLSRIAERLGRPELADRLHFAARLRYCVAGPPVALATVALLLARKERVA